MRLEVPLPERGGRAVELTCKSQFTGLPFTTGAVADTGCLQHYCLGLQAAGIVVPSEWQHFAGRSCGATPPHWADSEQDHGHPLQGQLTGAQSLHLEVGNGSPYG
jgi:hypothetical protein